MNRRARLALIAGLTTLLLAVGSGAAYAWWTVTTTVGSTATAASVGVTHALSGSTLNVTYSSSTGAAVGVVTVTNTGTRDGTYSLAISATSASTTLRSAVVVEVGTTASCTTTATLTTPVTGTFAATVTKTGTIAAGASVALCVRTSMTPANITANALGTLSATAATSITMGTFTATATPAITFTQSVAASATIEVGPWFWIKKSGSPERCAEADNYGTASGTPVTTGSCGLDTQATSNANEFWRFVPTSSGYYRIINRNVQTMWWSVPSATALQPLQITAGTGTTQEWLPVLNADGTYTFKLRANTALCAETTGNGNGAAMRINTCAVSTAQTFSVVKLYTITPATIALSCAADGFNAVYTWPLLTGYENEVTYRVLIDGVVDTVHTGATGNDPNARFGWAATTAAYTVGTHTVEVQSTVAGSAWWSVGTGTLVRGAGTPWLACS